MRNRKVTKYGNTNVIQLRPHDMEDLGLNYGDEVDIGEITVNKKKVAKKK